MTTNTRSTTSLIDESRPLKSRPPLRDQPIWVKKGILLGNMLHYRKKDPFKHNSLNLSVLCLILVSFMSLSCLSIIVPTVVYLPIAMLGFGLCHYMLFILVVHEASHNMFIVSKNIRQSLFWNRFFGWAVATFYGVEYGKHWELGHQIHHHNAISEHDPQNCPNTIYSGANLFKYTIVVLLVPGYYQFFRKYDQCEAPKHYGMNPMLLAGQLLLWGLLIAGSMYCFNWTVPVALFLGIQVVSALNQFKIAMEHGGEIGRRESVFLRSCSSFFPFRWLFMPLNISLHFEHHLNYCVPWYELMNYHRELKKVVPAGIQSQVFHYNAEVWQQINQY
jgi:fatty acid desaturase